MKKLIYSLIFVWSLSLAGCTLPQMIKLAKEQKVEVKPNPLEVHKDTVTFNLSGKLPAKLLKRGTIYTLNVFYHYNDNDIALKPIEFKYDDYPNNKTEPITITKPFSFPYQDAYRTGTVDIQGVASKEGKAKDTPRLSIATGIITTSRLVQHTYYAAFADHGYNNQEELVAVVIPDFIFERGKSNLRKSELAAPKGQQLDAYIAAKNATQTVTITGTHSPEGLERINGNLSQERGNVIEKFYRAQMKKYDYTGVAANIKFIQKPIVDDWTSFKTALSAYNGITDAEKAAYTDILNNGGTFESQELAVEKLGTYRKVFKDIYPSLRSAKTEILMVKPKKEDAEISVLAKRIATGQEELSALSYEELMYAATLTPSLDEKTAIYQVSTKKGSNWKSYNNLAACYIQQIIDNPAKMEEFAKKAATQLDIASKIEMAPEVLTNLASISLMNGNPLKAYNYAVQALAGSPSSEVASGVNGVKGACQIHKALYREAVVSISAATDTYINLFNKGLAQTLTKDYTNATNSFVACTTKNPHFALGYYGAAIVAARTENSNDVVSNLTSAVKLDPTLKQKALTDLEFAKYSPTDTFRNALK